MTQPNNVCTCGKPKSARAEMCQECRYAFVKVKPVPVEYEVDPVKDALMWVMLQSRGHVS